MTWVWRCSSGLSDESERTQTILKGKNIENLQNNCEHSILPCPASFTVVCLPQHTWFKWQGHYQASAERDVELIIWIRCVGAGKHLKHAGQGRPTGPGLIKTRTCLPHTFAGVSAEVIILFQQMRKPIIFMYWFNLLIKTVIIKPNIKQSEICRACAASLPLTEKVMIWD